MMDVRNRWYQCGNAQAYFGEVGGKAVSCKLCKTSEMVNVVSKRGLGEDNNNDIDGT